MVESRPILVVDEWAHIRGGHHPVLFAETASALMDLGCEVTALLPEGWALEDPEHLPPFSMRGLPPFANAVHEFGGWLGRQRPRRVTRVAKRVICDVAVTLSAGRLARRLGADVIMMTPRPRPYVVLLLASARRWVVFQFSPHGSGIAGWTDRFPLGRAISAAEQLRNRRGGGVVLLVNGDAALDSWRPALPGVEVLKVGFAGSREVHPKAGVRASLGIDPSARVALLFGSDRGHKRTEPVLALFTDWEAAGEAPEWHLVAGGECGDSARTWQEQRGLTLERTHVFPGFASDDLRNDLHEAADVVVLSFRPGWELDSGMLVDAVSWGKPVVCSDDCGPAEMVHALGIGVTFENGSEQSLGRALRTMPLDLSEDTKRRAQEQCSIHAVAERYLRALDGIGR